MMSLEPTALKIIEALSERASLWQFSGPLAVAFAGPRWSAWKSSQIGLIDRLRGARTRAHRTRIATANAFSPGVDLFSILHHAGGELYRSL